VTTSPSPDESFLRLHQAGRSIGDVAVWESVMTPTLAKRSFTLALRAWSVLIVGGAVFVAYKVLAGVKPLHLLLLLFLIYPLMAVAAGCAGVGLVLGLVALETERHGVAWAGVGVLLNVLVLVLLALAKVTLGGP
jgi:hypothetical protein